MKWASMDILRSKIEIPAGYSLELLKREDVLQLTENLRQWYPDIVVGSETCHLDPQFYFAKTFLAGSAEDQNLVPIVMKEGMNICLFITLEKNPDAMTITSRMGAIAPDHRGKGLANLGPIILETMGRSMGAELAYYFATLKIPHQQVSAETCGFRLVGIVPAFDRDMVSPGNVKRVYEALYAKVLVPEDAIVLPHPKALTPTTKALWDFLFTKT
jgi:hypothetical protein